MTEAVGSTLRWLQFVFGALLVGAMTYAALAPSRDAASRGARLGSAISWASLWLLCAALSAVATLVWLEASVSGHDIASTRPVDLWRFVSGTRVGKVWLWREWFALVLLLAMLNASRMRSRMPFVHTPYFVFLVAAAIAYQATLAFAGHGAGSDAAGYAMTLRALHVATSSVWLGGLAALTLAAWRAAEANGEGGEAVAAKLRAFSPLATGCMVVLAASGAWVAWGQVGTWPALLGTRYGWTLLAKIAAIFGVLAAAGHVRWRLLPGIDAAFGSRLGARRVAVWLLLELVCAAVVSWLASLLGTRVPALHDDIEWLLPIRIAPTTALALPEAPWRWSVVGVVAGIGIACAFWPRMRRSGPGRAALAIALPSVLAAGVWALAIPAFPDTYRRSPVPYQAVSVAAGQALFRKTCTACHGADGSGRGAVARMTLRPPADLTAPHAADHTPGDMFWWLTHGIPAGGMPDFAVFSDEARWDLVNYLHTLSRSHQARVLRERVVPGRPWLGAPDFDYVDTDGRSGALRDYRGRSAVLIVVYTSCGSTARLAQLDELSPQLAQRGVTVLAIPAESASDDACGRPAHLATVREGNVAIAATYSMFRHTLEELRPGDGPPGPPHLEFLIDRFGYLRARWLPQDTKPGWADPGLLIAQIELLAAEPEILPPPDEHLH